MAHADIIAKRSVPSARWIEAIANSSLQQEIRKQIRGHMSMPSGWKQTRIAILDTGYCPDSPFFQSNPRWKRILGWHDFTEEDSPVPCDSSGHGTHVLSCAMKVAPSADYLVARVARRSEDLCKVGHNVAKVDYDNSSWKAEV
jgi:hypothetical protein